MLKTFLLALLIALAFGRTYPLYKQCDARWANEQLGTSSNTICKAGCAMSSAAMGLSGAGHSFTPSTLNTWLKNNGGYVSGDLLVWGSLNKLGLTFEGKVANSQIKSKLDQGRVVICNVHNGGHWVLATGYSGDNISVNDPGYSTTAYSLSQIVDGQNAVYRVGNGIFGSLSGLRTDDNGEIMADGGILEGQN
jgi:hypothetical protein